MRKYSFDNAWEKARQRLRGFEARYDPGTIRHLEILGVEEGWHCLEVGGGGGTIVEWLCQRVGPTGHVLATDLDTRFLETLDYPNLEVRRHDIVADSLPERAFGLIHERMVLPHLPERDTALQRMISALRPGGWLLCEHLDDVSMVLVSPPDAASHELYNKVRSAFTRAMTARGHVFDGRRLYGLFQTQGLTAVQAEGRVTLAYTGPGTEFLRLTVEQLRGDIVHAGYATDGEIEAYFALLNDPSFVSVAPTMFAVWGRRPDGHSPALLSKSSTGNG